MVAAPRTMASTRLGWNGASFGRWELEWQHLGSYYLEATNRHSYPGHDLLNLRWLRQFTPALHVAARLLNSPTGTMRRARTSPLGITATSSASRVRFMSR
jgi:hypothetical protein